MLDAVAASIPRAAKKLIERFWPGPLTLVLPARKGLPPPLVNAAGGVGVRISSAPVARRLVEALGRPLTATSANPAGQRPARTTEEARSYFSDRVQVFLDGGALTSRIGSTVVEFAGDRVRMLRDGEISASELEKVLGPGKVLRQP
jgi:L-threonylcarbamoyladenylate synthase